MAKGTKPKNVGYAARDLAVQRLKNMFVLAGGPLSTNT
jgi:hypothetical protein